MNSDVNNDPLHGKSLEVIMNYLVDEYGWEDLGNIIKINCFRMNPSVKSSLKFLRKTPWAREKVEKLYVESL
jgi:uncharacterized protein (DUF2132 family)